MSIDKDKIKKLSLEWIRKKEIKIIKKKDNNQEYTFVSDNVLKNVKNECVTNEKKSVSQSNEIIQKKIHSRKSHHKGRKVLGKSIQGHSPVYE